jgi:hypothetical protein
MASVGKGLAAVACLALAACGGGEDDAAPGGDEGTTTTSTGAQSGECPDTDLSVSNLTTGATVDVVDATAVSLSGGAAYTAYAADFEVDPNDISLVSGIEPASGENVVTLAVTVFNAEGTPPPIEAGTEITYTDEFGVLTFVVVHSAGAESFGDNTGAAGTLTVTSVGDRFCAEVDYADDEKELTGTIAADVRSL